LGVTKRVFLVAVVMAMVGLMAGLVWFGLLRKRKAAILVETVPTAMVYIDGEAAGRTPYEGELVRKEVVVKLVPEGMEEPLLPYETKVVLTPGVKTIVRRALGKQEGESYGEEISFEKLPGKMASVAVVTEPDGARVYLNGDFKDVAPLKLGEVNPGVYQVTVGAEGYVERSFSVQVVAGYGVTVVVDLEQRAGDVQGEAAEGEDELVREVLIKNTPTGFLRVREEAGTQGKELMQVKPGERYQLLEESEGKDWYRIDLGDGEGGWVSVEYAEIVEQQP